MNKALRIRAVKWAQRVLKNTGTVRNWMDQDAQENLARAWLAGARALDLWHRTGEPWRRLQSQYEEIRQLKAKVAELERKLEPPMRSIETDAGSDLDYWLFGIKRPEGMPDTELRDILRDRAFADVIKLVAEADWQRRVRNAVLDQRPEWADLKGPERNHEEDLK